MIVNKAKLFSIPARLDERDFEKIFSEYYSKVHGILYRLTGDPLEADDLTAETFWRLWERPPFQNDNLGGWLYRVAMRLGYNLLRANRRRKYYEQHAGQETREERGTPDPAEAAEQASERQRVHKILSRMPERDVQVLILRHSGLSYKEIAASLSVSPSSIGTLLARAEQHFEMLYRKGE